MRSSLFLLAILPSAALAQAAPPIRLINAPDASTKPQFGLVTGVRQLPSGGVLVNDALKRQLTMFDATLANPTVVADSVSGGANSYGTRPGGLIPYHGDSTLFVDPAGLSMFVLDGKGAIARVASVPRSQDAGAFASGAPRLDAKGRIVYRGGGGPQRITASARPNNGAANNGPVIQMPEPPDSAAVVRIDPVSRKLDTAAFIKIPKTKMNMTQTDGRMSVSIEMNPLQVIDDWAVLSDGSVAVIRGRDYHIDWINADGSTTTTPKLPFDWQRLSDEDKVALIDSAKAAMERSRTTMAGGPGGAAVMGGAGAERGMVVFNAMADGAGQRTMVAGGPGGPGGPQVQFVSPSELPDYRPPFAASAALGDADGNLWIRTTSVRAGAVNAGPIYDVISRKGEVIDRVQVPAGRSIVGFGQGGVVYMIARDERGTWVERTKR
ncbi:MAG TPA: hypothetical protein VIP11_25950 [Gemmatimonadaceae bacterium]